MTTPRPDGDGGWVIVFTVPTTSRERGDFRTLPHSADVGGCDVPAVVATDFQSVGSLADRQVGNLPPRSPTGRRPRAGAGARAGRAGRPARSAPRAGCTRR